MSGWASSGWLGPFLAATHATLLELDAEGTIVGCHAPALMLGASRTQDVVGAKLSEVMTGASLAPLLELVGRAAREGHTGQLTCELGLMQGSRVVLVDVLPAPSGARVGLLIRDVGHAAPRTPTGISVYLAALLRLAALKDTGLQATLQEIFKTVSATLGAARVSYWLLEGPERLVCQAKYDAHHPGALATDAPLVEGCPEYFHALRTEQVIVVHDTHADPRVTEMLEGYLRPRRIGAMLDVPLWRQGVVAGVLCTEHVGLPRMWAAVEQEFAVSVGQMVLRAIAAEEGRRQRRALEESEERLRLLARVTHDILWTWSPGMRSVELVEELPDLLGHPVTGRVLTSHAVVELIHPEDRARVTRTFQEALATEVPSWAEGFRIRRGDGTWAHVLSRAFLHRDGQGAVTRVVGSTSDVTEQRRLEAQLVERERLASIGTLAAGVAHEINNPLAFVTVNLSYMQEALDRTLGSLAPGAAVTTELLGTLQEFTEAVREARTGTARVKQIVRDLQAFSRPEPAAQGPVDVRAVLEGALTMALPTLRQRARLVRELQPVPPVVADPGRLSQVFLNIILNAAHAIPDGTATEHTVTVRSRTRAEGGALVEVEDDGVGIPVETQKRIFEPFFTTKPVGEGTGLGLSVCHGIVRALGGEITFESTPGKGTTFRVLLPSAPAPAVEKPAPIPAPVRTRILAVDDEPWIITGLRRAMGRAHEVVAVHSGREALEKLARDDAFDVILCDLMMPDLTGMDVHEALRATRPDLVEKMVFMTGGTFTQRAREFLDGVPNPRLVKPFEVTELEAILEQRRKA